jgi:dihydroflavonol-4-reductase
LKNLVTGATGHIGNVLVRQLLDRGETVRVLVLPHDDLSPLDGLDVNIAVGDILDETTLTRAMEGISRVFHLAGMISIMPGQADYLEMINVGGTRNMLSAAREAGVKRFVYTSSIHALGCIPHGEIIDERFGFDPCRTMGDYDRSKAKASLLVLEAAKNGLDSVIVCPTGVIGPHDYKQSEMGALIKDTIHGVLAFSVNGAYDFVDVRDIAAGLILAGEQGENGSIYILSGEHISITDILKTAYQSSGRRVPIIQVPMSLARIISRWMPLVYQMTGEKPRFTPYSMDTVCSNSIVSHLKATTELGYEPRSIRQSVRDTIHWLLDQNKLAAERIRE